MYAQINLNEVEIIQGQRLTQNFIKHNKQNKHSAIFKKITIKSSYWSLSISSSQDQLMSYLPQISEQQRRTNIKKLIHQNKKLHGEIFVFEEQISKILSNFTEQQKTKMQQYQAARRSSSRQRRSQLNFASQTLPIKLQKSAETSLETLLCSPTLQNLLSSNSPLIETKVIPGLKQRVEYLKSLNIKQNMHYVLKEEDDLKIVKMELYRLRKEKQVVKDFVKDKTIKLQKENAKLEDYKNSLRKDLSDTIKFNRQSAGSITQIQREIRKYHLMLHEYKRLSSSSLAQGKDKNLVEKIKDNPSAYLEEMQKEAKQFRQQIAQFQSKWKDQLEALDKQYYQLKQELQKKLTHQKSIRQQQTFNKTRILVMKDEEVIQQQKQKQSLVKVSPKLQKQLQEYLKEEQEKLRKKQEYLKKHRPRDKDEEEYQKILISSAAKSPNPENTIVQTSHDDKNIVKLKSYLRQKEKVDKQIEAKLKKSPAENQRLERSWSQTQEEIQVQGKLSETNMTKKDREKKYKVMPRILLKSVKLGTTFHNQSEEENF